MDVDIYDKDSRTMSDARQAFEQAIYRHALAVQVEWKGPRAERDRYWLFACVRADLEVNVVYEAAIDANADDPVAFERVADRVAADIQFGILARLRDNAIEQHNRSRMKLTLAQDGGFRYETWTHGPIQNDGWALLEDMGTQ